MPHADLPPAPRSPVDDSGKPAVGAYAGWAERVSWDGLRGPWAHGALYRLAHKKTWHYVSIAGERCITAFVIIDVGYAASAFAYVFDRVARRLLCDLSFTALPGASTFGGVAGAGARSRFMGGGAELLLERPAGLTSWRVVGRGPGGFELDATIDAAGEPPTLFAVAEIAGGVANCTHKTVCLPARGTVAVGAARIDLAGSYAALDFTCGLLARHTRWRWASASGATVGLNFVDGFNGPIENVVWLDGRIVPVGPVEFHFDAKDTQRPWRIRSADGVVDLEFVPEGERREDKNLLIARSCYVQPFGTFRGVIRPPDGPAVTVENLLGVTEDHIAKW